MLTALSPIVQVLVLVAPAAFTVTIAATTATTITAAASTTAAAATTAATTATATVPAAAAATSVPAATTAFAAAPTATTASAAIERHDILSLGSLLALSDFEFHFLAFFQFAEPASLNSGEVHETILAPVIGCDESVPLFCVEPLHYSCRAHRALSPLAVSLESA